MKDCCKVIVAPTLDGNVTDLSEAQLLKAEVILVRFGALDWNTTLVNDTQ